MSYELSRAADRDIEDIYDYTCAQFGAHQAVNYLTEMQVAFIALSRQPGMGRARDEIRKGLRSMSYESHVIFYRKIRGGIRIVRILHGRRDMPRQFDA